MAAGVLTFSSKSSGPEQDHVTSSFLMQIIIHDSLCLVAQLCPALCNPTDCSPPGSSVHGDSPGKNTGVGCHTLLQEIFPTQGLNPGLTHCRWTLPSEPPGKLILKRDIISLLFCEKAMPFFLIMWWGKEKRRTYSCTC